MSTKNTLMVIALVSCAAFGSSAYADDFKVMPGSACQPRSPDDRQNVFALLDGVTNANPTDPAVVQCPIVRDNTTPIPSAFMQVRLSVKGNANDEPVSCVLNSRDDNGRLIEDSEGSGGNATAIAVHLFLTVNGNPDRDGSYVVQCRLPPGGDVVSYRYIERSPTDENN
jgi:hypothetical protein